MKTHLFIKNVVSRMFVLTSFLLLAASPTEAQECACKQGVNVSIGGNGTATVTAAMMLASNSTCAGTHTVTVMKTPNGLPIPGSPTVNCTHVGQTLYAKVTNGSNSCWGTINIMDEMNPTITPPTGITTLTCLEMINYEPAVNDNCPGATAVIVNETITPNNCTSGLPDNVLKVVTRTYRATDKAGNTSSDVVFTFHVTTIEDLNDIDFPANLVKMNNTNLHCEGGYAVIPNNQPFAGNPSPVDLGSLPGTGVPSFDGVDLYPLPNDHCKISVGFSDVVLGSSNCVTKILRTWQVVEWSCEQRTTAPVSQLIEIADTKLPVITPPADRTISTSNHACEASLALPAATVSDNCTQTSLINVDVTYPGGFNDNVNGGPATLPVGVHTITYTAYDWCGNSSSASMTLTVKDNTPPVSICDEYTTVALANEGLAHVPASVLDDGSYDECSPVKMVVRRMNNSQCGPCDTPELPGFHYMGDYGTGADKRYYYLSKHTATPDVAFKMAKALGGNIVTIDSPAKDAWIWSRFLQLVPTSAPDWIDLIIGLHDLDGDGKYTWQSGSTSTYRNWGTGQPGSNPASPYVTKYHDFAGQWYPYSVYQTKYIVEIADPCGWSSYAHFCCSDIPNEQMVSFRAIDEAGNYNDCMVNVRVQDKIGPTITCPDHMTVSCDFSFNMDDLATPFGWPTASDNCENLDIDEINVQNTMNACRIGSIRRDFQVTDQGGRTATCFQIITFNETEPFVRADITWPQDYMNLEGCADPTLPAFSPDVLGRPTFADGACALVGADYEDKVFSFNNGNGPACFKIIRTWTVIDWCQPISNGNGIHYATWTHPQTIVVNDPVAPVFEPLEASISTCTYDATCSSGFIDLIAEASDNCTAVLAYTWKIDANNDGTFEPGLSGSGHANIIDASGTYPVGTHKIVYSFEDKCGNLSTREQLFSIINCKAPTAICHNGLSVNLTPMDMDGDGTIDTGMATVDVHKFNKGSNHTCQGYDLIFSFEEITLQGNMVVTTDEIVFNCEDIGSQPITMYVGVLTPMGQINQAFCTTFIDVQDNDEACEGRLIGGLVSGRIANSKEETIENVSVSLGGTELKYNTLDNGMYVFSNLPTGNDYQVNPFKNDDVMNGISTLDLVLIQRHILEMESLSDPFNLIAADVNKDKVINTIDLVELRKVILGSVDVFPNNTSWRFIDGQYKFIDPSHSYQENFNERYDIFGFNKDMIVDFVGVKTGDVNNTASANSALKKAVETRSSIVLSTPQQVVKAGDMVRIPVYATALNELSGAQFTMTFDQDALELTNVLHGVTNDENMGMTRLSDGLVTFSWHAAGNAVSADQPMFTLEFRAISSCRVSDVFEINSSVLSAEAYTAGLETRKVNWKVDDMEHGFIVYQNVPNPFSQVTTITFEAPEAGEVICSVRDLSGKLVKEMKQFVGEGVGSFGIHSAELPASGVYFYTLQMGQQRETRMMVVLE